MAGRVFAQCGPLAEAGSQLTAPLCPLGLPSCATFSDLSSTSLNQLPSVGLHHLRTLIIRDTYALKRIPSIYAFPMLENAHLTYAYHCCSFHYPKTHDPRAYEQHQKAQVDLSVLCSGKQSANQASGSTRHMPDFEGYFTSASHNKTQSESSTQAGNASNSSQSKPRPDLAEQGQQATELGPNSSQPHRDPLSVNNFECDELGGQLSSIYNISCTPEPDAFNPCEDIMGYPILRVAVWFVVGASVFGNLSVIVVLASIFKRLSVPKFLQLNLAIGDLFMGVYLAMLALADLTTVGSYFNYAIDWQHGYGCKVAGAASLFASQLSIFTLSVITFERYYTITYSIDLNMRLQLDWAARIMFLGWLYAFASAMLPIFADINSYSKTSICLPMRTTSLNDRLFIIVLLIIDSSAFVIIFACYLKMYLLILRQKTEATAKERTVAMRMALFVSTDFACWAPIIFFGATALFGRPLISVTNSKILIVFFYPLNSMANPFLYVISTRQYRRDLNYLASRWSVWRKTLFNRNNDSYLSNNAHPGQANNQFQAAGSLHVQLGAVAAVTGVARHLHRNQFSESALDKAAIAEALGAEFAPVPLEMVPQNLPERRDRDRFVHTRLRSTGFVLRHQIITGNGPRHAQSSRPRRQPNCGASRPVQTSRKQGSLEPRPAVQPAPSDSGELESKPSPELQVKEGGPSAANITLRPSGLGEPRQVVSADQSHQGHRIRRCCRICCKYRQTSQLDCHICQAKAARKSCELPVANSGSLSRECAPVESEVKVRVCKPKPHMKRRKQAKASQEEQAIDILGNLSNNDANSSPSAISSSQLEHSNNELCSTPAPRKAKSECRKSKSGARFTKTANHVSRQSDIGQLEQPAIAIKCRRCREAERVKSDQNCAARCSVNGPDDRACAAEPAVIELERLANSALGVDQSQTSSSCTDSSRKKRVSIAS